MDIGSRIDQAMRNKGYKTHAALSRASGVAESTITRILKLSGNPTADTLAALAQTLNVSIDWIVNGSDNTNQPPPEHLVIFDKKEIEMINAYRQANSNGKALFDAATYASNKHRLDDTE